MDISKQGKSGICWRIAGAVFAAVLLLQAAALATVAWFRSLAPGEFLPELAAALLLVPAGTAFALMLGLRRRFLVPLEVLRHNLLSAVSNPENPELKPLPRGADEEMNAAIGIASELIRHNSDNLARLRVQAEDKIRKLAYFDSLTGLPNRTLLMEKLEESIRHGVLEEGGKLAVISVDIDNFKDINDSMGHETGDRLLDAVGKRLVRTLPPETVVARISADEFTAIIRLGPDYPDSAVFVERIFVSMIEPVTLPKDRLQVRVSIGVTHCPEDGADARQLLKNADVALNRAKEEGRDTVRYYSQDFDRIIQRRFRLLRDLRLAMDQKQLKLHYHPQFDLRTGRLVGAEALLRWRRPEGGPEGGAYVPPAEFIPIAEQSGLIVPIGEYVLRTACEANRKWQEKGLPPMRIAVNISSVQFHRGDIVKLVSAVLKETGLEPRWLELEVTEGVYMERTQAAIATLEQLHRLGVDLAVDDFGTGYSSLSYLRQFPIDRLKIDRSFIANAAVNPDDRVIVRTIIQLGHNLGLKVLAEGVESAEHEALLREEGCDESQGFKYIQPIPEEEFWDFAAAYNRDLARRGGQE